MVVPNRDKPPNLEAIFNRLDRKHGIQDMDTSCAICGKNFSTCTHTMAQVDTFKEVWKLMNLMGRKRVS
jgi:hypothetical protein